MDLRDTSPGPLSENLVSEGGGDGLGSAEQPFELVRFADVFLPDFSAHFVLEIGFFVGLSGIHFANIRDACAPRNVYAAMALPACNVAVPASSLSDVIELLTVDITMVKHPGLVTPEN